MNFRTLLAHVDPVAEGKLRIIPEHIIRTVINRQDPVAYLMVQKPGTLGYTIGKKVLPKIVGDLQVRDKPTFVNTSRNNRLVKTGIANDIAAVRELVTNTIYKSTDVFNATTMYWLDVAAEGTDGKLSATDMLLIASGDDIDILNDAIKEKDISHNRTVCADIKAHYKPNLNIG